jgi:hypothetical protein
MKSSDYPLWVEYLADESKDKGSFEQYKKRKLKKQRRTEHERNHRRNRAHEQEFVIEGYTTPFKEEMKKDKCIWNEDIRRWIAPNEAVHKHYMAKIDIAYQEKYGLITSTVTSTGTSLANTKRKS